MPIALAFVDTDNYTSAAAALEYVVPQTLVGGVIVFDHYTGDGAHCTRSASALPHRTSFRVIGS